MTLLHASEDCNRKNTHSGVLVATESVVYERIISKNLRRNNVAKKKKKGMYLEKNAINPTQTALESNLVLRRVLRLNGQAVAGPNKKEKFT